MVKLNKETKVGIFAVLGILVFILGYNFLKGFNPLRPVSTYYVVYKNVGGIVKSTQVTINGLKVGQIENISMLKPGDPSNILVTMMINRDVRIPRGSRATISSSDLLGTKVLSLTLTETNQYMTEGDTLVAGFEASLSSTISSLVSPLKDKSEQVLVTLDRVLSSMNDIFDSTGTQKLSGGINDFTGMMAHIRNISERMDALTIEENERLRNILGSFESIMKNIEHNNNAITLSLKNISRISDSVAASNLTTTINNTQKVMAEFALTLDKINRGQGSLGKLANDTSLYVNLTHTSAELTSLMKDMQEYPGRYFSVSVFGNKRAEKQDQKREQDKKRK